MGRLLHGLDPCLQRLVARSACAPACSGAVRTGLGSEARTGTIVEAPTTARRTVPPEPHMPRLALSSPAVSWLPRSPARCCASTGTAAAKKPVPATFVGDSVAASISYTPEAQTVLSRGAQVQARPARLPASRHRRLSVSGIDAAQRPPGGAIARSQSLVMCWSSTSATTNRQPGTGRASTRS